MTLRSLGECVMYTLSYPRFHELVRRFPEVGLAVIRALSVRLRWVAQLAVTLETQSAHERLCGVLLALVDRFAVPCDQGAMIDLKLTNEDLAAIAGVSAPVRERHPERPAAARAAAHAQARADRRRSRLAGAARVSDLSACATRLR